MKTIAINNAKSLAKMDKKSKEFKSKVLDIYKVVNPEYKIGDDTTEWVSFKKAVIKALDDESNFVFKNINIVGIAKTKAEPKPETKAEPENKPETKAEPKAEPKTKVANTKAKTKSEPKTETDVVTTDVKSELVKSIAIDLANGKMTIEQKLEALRLLANI